MNEINTDGIKTIDPLCPYYSECGGCQYQHISYEDELRLKDQYVRGLFKEKFDLPDAVIEPILTSRHEYRYRNRLDLKLVQTKDKQIFIGFSPMGGHRLIPIEDCLIARQEIALSIPEIKIQAAYKVQEKHRQANLVVRTSDDRRVRWGGIGRRSLQLPEADYLWAQMAGRRVYYSLDTFFQANVFIVSDFINRLRTLKIWNKDTIFYDLYGGVGLFGICLHDLVGQVVLIEEVKASLTLARFNVQYHNIKNFTVFDGKVEDVLPGLLEQGSDGNRIVMVDPPRAGLSQITLEMLNALTKTEYLLYLSCNPETLVANCETLRSHWKITRVEPLDFFPRTRHLETFVVMQRR